MIPLLKILHDHAAKRGDGLRTEFFRHMSRQPAHDPAVVDPGASERPRADNDHGKPQRTGNRRGL